MDAPPPVPFVPQSSWPSDRLWFDPVVINAATSFTWQDFTAAANTNIKVLTPNPRRWGIGFAAMTGLASLTVAPWPQVDTVPLLGTGTSTAIPFLTLFTYGPLITAEWWIRITNPTTIRVVQLIRN